MVHRLQINEDIEDDLVLPEKPQRFHQDSSMQEESASITSVLVSPALPSLSPVAVSECHPEFSSYYGTMIIIVQAASPCSMHDISLYYDAFRPII